MKKMKFAVTAILLLLAGSFSSCEKDIDMSKIDFSNIENLYEQPLPVIQKAVQGSWKWGSISTWGILGHYQLNHTFIEISEDKVIVNQEDGDIISLENRFTFTYSWKRMKTFSGRKEYVMWNNELNKAEWRFIKIQNGMLHVESYDINAGVAPDWFIFLKI